MKLLPLAMASLTTLAIISPGGDSDAGQVHVLGSVMIIAKSSNRNQVHYAVAVDESCAPAGPTPIHPYWRMLERGPTVTEPLTASEDRVLGVERQELSTDAVHFALRGLPGRAFTIHTARAGDGTCSSWVGTTIAGVPARLGGIYVQQKLFGAVDYVQMKGFAENGTTVSERVVP